MKLGRMQIGLLITAVYATGVGVLLALRWDEVRSLDLNALGDFAAGAAGPIAFLWLVLGYFQQGDELRINTEALQSQAEELRQSVAAQEALASAMRAQNSLTEKLALADVLRRKRLIQPAFSLEISSLYKRDAVFVLNLRVTNHGAECRELFIDVFDNDDSSAQHALESMVREQKTLFDVELAPSIDHELMLKFIYLDQESDRQEQEAFVNMPWVGEPARFAFHAPSQTIWHPDELPAEN